MIMELNDKNFTIISEQLNCLNELLTQFLFSFELLLAEHVHKPPLRDMTRIYKGSENRLWLK